MSQAFDKIAPAYVHLERILFDSRLQAMRCAFLNRVTQAKKVLLVGEGPGSFLAELLKTNQEGFVTVVEPSARMISLARSRVKEKDLDRVSFLRSTLEVADLSRSYDAACTICFWDCFTEAKIRNLFPKMSRCIKNGGKWLNVDFCEPKNCSPISHFLLLRFLYGFFDLATGIGAMRVVDVEPIANSNGLHSLQCKQDKIFPIKAQFFAKRFQGDPF